MTRFSLAPGYITINYDVLLSGLNVPHHMRYQINPTPPAWTTLFLLANDQATSVLWTAAVDAQIAILRPIYDETCTFIDATLHRQDTASSEPSLVASYPIGLIGSSAGINLPAQQDKFIFRSSNGNLFYSVLMESTAAVNVVSTAGTLGVGRLAWVNYITGGASVMKARDNGRPFAFLRAITKSNDPVRKIRLGL